MRTLYIIRGCSASGKSTIAAALFDKHFNEEKYFTNKGSNVTIRSTDDLWYDASGKYCFDYKLLGAKHKENQRLVEEDMKTDREVIIVDNTNTTRKEMKPYIELAEKYNYEIRKIVVDTPLETCIMYNNQRNEDRKIPEDVIRAQHRRLFGER